MNNELSFDIYVSEYRMQCYRCGESEESENEKFLIQRSTRRGWIAKESIEAGQVVNFCPDCKGDSK